MTIKETDQKNKDTIVEFVRKNPWIDMFTIMELIAWYPTTTPELGVQHQVRKLLSELVADRTFICRTSENIRGPKGNLVLEFKENTKE